MRTILSWGEGRRIKGSGGLEFVNSILTNFKVSLECMSIRE